MNDIIKPSNELTALCLTGNKVYDSRVKLFNKWLNGRPVNMENVNKFLDLVSKTFSASTFDLTKTALKQAIIISYPKENFNLIFLQAINTAFKAVKNMKPDKKVHSKDVLNEKQVKEMIEKSDPKTAILIKTLAKTGLRVSELLSIKISDIETVNGLCHIRVLGKGRKERIIKIPEKLIEEIKNTFKSKTYLFQARGKGDTPYSRTTAFRLIKEAGKIIGRKDLHPHHLRHFFATYHIKTMKQSVKAVSNYLGHSTTAITQDMYLHDELKAEDIFEEGEF